MGRSRLAAEPIADFFPARRAMASMPAMTGDKLVQCFVQALGVQASEVNDALAYGTHRKWNSVAHMMLVAEIETAFGVMLDTDDIVDMSSVGKARQILAKHGAAA